MALASTDYDRLAAVVAEIKARQSTRFRSFFPEAGAYRRDLYPKHLEFFGLGARFKERLFMAANRIGKSESGAYETTCHLTGLYPDWWTGKRFTTPIDAWVCGTNSQTTRDVVQGKLLGAWNKPDEQGMIPPHLVLTKQAGRGSIPGMLESATIRHVSGGVSTVGFKTYEQGRQSFEGTAKHLIWDDEEPPADVYTEQVLRTMTTKGIVIVTFTPLQGMSEVVTGFLEPSDDAKAVKTFVQAGWKHVPHLDAAEIQAIKASTPPYQLQARTEGEPSLGAGAIYPIGDADLIVPTRAIPETWRRVYGMDVGWNRTAVIWAAEEPGTGILELYAEHYMGQGEPASHAQAIRARGEWIDGVIDPASQGGSQIDGRTLIDIYTNLGLRLNPAVNAVEAGLTEVWNLMVSGRLKVQAHLHNWLSEFRKYHRDEKGKIVKHNDHLMDATRYLVVSGRDLLKVQPRKANGGGYAVSQSWMGA